jgi:hypothetical protein
VIEESSRVVTAVARDARVERTLSVLGTTLHVDSLPVFALGVEGERQSLYRVIEGTDLVSGGDVLLNRNAAEAFHVTIGDTLQLNRNTSEPLSRFLHALSRVYRA